MRFASRKRRRRIQKKEKKKKSVAGSVGLFWSLWAVKWTKWKVNVVGGAVAGGGCLTLIADPPPFGQSAGNR